MVMVMWIQFSPGIHGRIRELIRHFGERMRERHGVLLSDEKIEESTEQALEELSQNPGDVLAYFCVRLLYHLLIQAFADVVDRALYLMVERNMRSIPTKDIKLLLRLCVPVETSLLGPALPLAALVFPERKIGKRAFQTGKRRSIQVGELSSSADSLARIQNVFREVFRLYAPITKYNQRRNAEWRKALEPGYDGRAGVHADDLKDAKRDLTQTEFYERVAHGPTPDTSWTRETSPVCYQDYRIRYKFPVFYQWKFPKRGDNSGPYFYLVFFPTATRCIINRTRANVVNPGELQEISETHTKHGGESLDEKAEAYAEDMELAAHMLFQPELLDVASWETIRTIDLEPPPGPAPPEGPPPPSPFRSPSRPAFVLRTPPRADHPRLPPGHRVVLEGKGFLSPRASRSFSREPSIDRKHRGGREEKKEEKKEEEASSDEEPAGEVPAAVERRGDEMLAERRRSRSFSSNRRSPSLPTPQPGATPPPASPARFEARAPSREPSTPRPRTPTIRVPRPRMMGGKKRRRSGVEKEQPRKAARL